MTTSIQNILYDKPYDLQKSHWQPLLEDISNDGLKLLDWKIQENKKNK
jgi:hypothetical protein